MLSYLPMRATKTSSVEYQRFDLSGSSPVATGSSQSLSFPMNSAREGMLGIQHANGRDYWVLVSGFSSIYVVLVSDASVSLHATVITNLSVFNGGYHLFAASPQGNKIAMSGNTSNSPGFDGDIAVWDFNTSTGELSNRQVINPTFRRHVYYGGEFSPDGTKLYFASLDESGVGSGPSGFYQYDFSASAFTTLATSSQLTNYGQARLGPDGKIYVAGNASGLHVVNSPNIAGTSADFQELALSAPPGCTVKLGLPQTPHRIDGWDPM